jgi:hypothetical protein
LEVRKKISSYLIIFLLLVAYTGSSLGLELELKQDDTGIVEDQSATSTSDTEKITLDHFNAIFQPAQLIFHSAFSFETEFPIIKDEHSYSVIDKAIIIIKYFKTLLSRIIVPNAP